MNRRSDKKKYCLDLLTLIFMYLVLLLDGIFLRKYLFHCCLHTFFGNPPKMGKRLDNKLLLLFRYTEIIFRYSEISVLLRVYSFSIVAEDHL